MKKISITGTKGKTTISNVLASVMRQMEPLVLHVDTNGVYLNGEIKYTRDDSRLIWDLVPTVAPGRFLSLLHQGKISKLSEEIHHDSIPGLAILETSLGCGSRSGLGYYSHNIGIFTNVYEDHIGSRDDLNNKKDIGQSKKFIFERIGKSGTAVFNADDETVCSLLDYCKSTVQLLPFGREFKHFDLKQHLINYGSAITIINDDIFLLHGSSRKKLLNINEVSWTFNGKYLPSLYNLIAIVAALAAYYDFKIPPKAIQALKDFKLDPLGGRLTLFKNNEVKVIADYAHEKQSLKNIAELASNLKNDKNNKVIGVLRLAWDRSDALIKETAEYISDSYDCFVIYDKIDGYYRKPSARSRTGRYRFEQSVGKVSKLFSGSISNHNPDKEVFNILREDLALEKAASLVKPGDVVVFIVNDDIKQSLDFLKKTFNVRQA